MKKEEIKQIENFVFLKMEELRKVNPNLAMEYLRIYTTMDKAQKHFNNFKKECNDWLDNIYKLGGKENE